MMWAWVGLNVSYEGERMGFRPSAEALAVGAEYRQIVKYEWIIELSKYKFIITVLGVGLQTAKTTEGLLVCTIPILPRLGFTLWDELIELGFPLVAVDDFAEV